MRKIIFTFVIAVSLNTFANTSILDIWTTNDQLSPGGTCFSGCQRAGMEKLKEICKTKYNGQLVGSDFTSKNSSGFITYGSCIIGASGQ